MQVSFALNGKTITVDSRPDRRVIDLLREDLGLTGTKEGCGTGECGACTVLIDGESRLSCLMVAAQIQGKSLVTIEGAGQEQDGVTDIQAAFVRHGAVQCGFCTPGMVMAVSDLLKREPNPGRERIREGISGNLCRCTGYQKIVEAVEAVAEERQSKARDRSP